MSCISHLNLCPASGDTENVLLQKILQSVNEGGGVAGVSSISLNGGAPQTGAVSISTGGTVTSVNGDPGPAVSLDSGEIPEGANLYFTEARVRSTPLTGLVATAGVVAATDTILQAFGKVAGTTNDLLNFRDTNAHADASIYINSGATEIVKVIGASSFISLASERLQRNIDSGKLALLGGISKTTGAYIEAHGDTSATVGHILLTTKGRASGGEGNLQIFNAAVGSAAADIRAAMSWEGNWAFTPTWDNIATTFTALKLNVTNTNSAAASLLLDLQDSATSRFNVAKTGTLRILGSSAATSLIHASTDTTATGLTIFEQASADTDSYDLSFRKTRGTVASPTVITSGDALGTIMFRGYSGAAGYVTAASIRSVSGGTIATTRVASSLIFATGTDAAPTVLTDRLTVSLTGFVGVGPSLTPSANLDVNNSTTVTKAYFYETTDGLASPANYSRTSLTTQIGNHLIRTEAAGTGTLRILQVGTGPTVGTNIAGVNAIFHGGQSTGSAAGGSILFQTSPAGGAGVGVNALATIATLSTTALSVTGNVVATGNVNAGANSVIFFSGRSLLYSPADGILRVSNVAGTDFNRLGFGGESSSFPALKRSTTFLQFRLADDSGFTGFTAGIGANAVVEVNATGLGFFASAPVVKQVSGANLTNNVTAGGTDDTIANYADLVVYANDSAAIRNDIYQLARKLKQVNDALRLYGLLT